jgi:hypothetical protein
VRKTPATDLPLSSTVPRRWWCSAKLRHSACLANTRRARWLTEHAAKEHAEVKGTTSAPSPVGSILGRERGGAYLSLASPNIIINDLVEDYTVWWIGTAIAQRDEIIRKKSAVTTLGITKTANFRFCHG